MSLDLIRETQQVLGDGDTKIADLLPKMVCKIIEREEWKKQADKEGQPFASFQQFVEYRLWWGLGISYAKLMRYCEDNETATRMLKEQIRESAAHGNGPGRGNKRDSNTTSFKQDRSVRYLVGRLKRDRPDLAEKVISGELSPNAAAIEAGFRTKTISVPVDAERAARVLLKHFDPAELIAALESAGVQSMTERMTR